MTQETENLSVPWTGLDVLLFFVLWIMALAMTAVVVQIVCNEREQPANAKSAYVGFESEGLRPHPIAQMIQHGKNLPIVLVVVFLSVVVTAPIVEEFVFRLLLQGWLEAKFRHAHVPGASRVAIVLASLCFAAIHIDNSGNFLCPKIIFYTVAAQIVVSPLVFLWGIFYLKRRYNVKMTDYLLGAERFFRPGFFIKTGYCLLAMLLCFGLLAILDKAFPCTNNAPVPIFFFALALGILYSKTQNLSYCILFHASLNATSLAIVWFTA